MFNTPSVVTKADLDGKKAAQVAYSVHVLSFINNTCLCKYIILFKVSRRFLRHFTD